MIVPSISEHAEQLKIFFSVIVGKQNGTHTMENSLVVYYRVKYMYYMFQCP